MRDLEVSKELLSEVLNLKVVSHGLLNKLNNSFDITYMPLEDDPYTRSMPININDFSPVNVNITLSVSSVFTVSSLLNLVPVGKYIG